MRSPNLFQPLSAIFLSALALASAPLHAEIENELLLVVGTPGTVEYQQIFQETLRQWQSAAALGQSETHVIPDTDEYSRETFQTHLAELEHESPVPLWIVLIGHGTFDGRLSKFNLAGPDLSTDDLEEWLEPFKRPVFLINTASSSGPFIPALSKENRIIITATKSGNELNYATFGTYFASALTNPEADLNNDGQNSLYECFRFGAHQTAAFYEQEGRIATETPLLDDNGDGRGTSLDAYLGVESGGESTQELDGSFADRWSLLMSEEEQKLPADERQRRNTLEAEIEALRDERTNLPEDEYYEKLEALMLQIANIYEQSTSSSR